MRDEAPLARNTVYSAISSASNVLLIALVIFAARVLGDRSFGEFSFALAVASIFEMVVDLGLNTLTVRNVARDKSLAGLYLPNILSWKLALSAAAMGLLVLSVNLLHQTDVARRAAYILGGAIVLRSYKATSHAFFQAYERFDLILLTTYVERVSVLVFGIGVLLFTRSLTAFAAVFALVRVPDLLFAYWLLHREITPIRVGFEPGVVRRLQVSAVPFGTYTLVAAAYSYTGTIILSVMRASEQVGWYSAGYKIYEGLTIFPFLLCAVLLPRLSRLFISDRVGHAALTLRVLRLLILGALPVLVSVSILAPQLVALLYGRSYLPAVPALRILLGAAALMFVNWVLNTALISADREGMVLKVAAMGLIVMVLANLIMVSHFGMIGAAYAVGVSELCVLGSLIVGAGRVLIFRPDG